MQEALMLHALRQHTAPPCILPPLPPPEESRDGEQESRSSDVYGDSCRGAWRQRSQRQQEVGPLVRRGAGAAAGAAFAGAEVVAHTLALGVAGKATVGAITVEPAVCDLGAMFVGKHYSATITLLNQSDGNMQYRLEAVDAETGELADDLGFDAPPGSHGQASSG